MKLAPSCRAAAIAALVSLAAGCGRSPVEPARTSATPARVAAGPVILDEDFSSRAVFPSRNWWNLDIHLAPVDPGSDAMIDWISGRTPSNPTATRALHPDFGPPPYGIPYVGVSDTQPLLPVTFVLYGNQSDAGAPGQPPGYPIPDEARTSANYIEGAVPGGGPSRRPPPAPHRSRPLAALRDLGHALERGGRALGSGIGRGVGSPPQRPATRGLDLRRRRRARDLPGLVRYDEVARRQPTSATRCASRRAPPTDTCGQRRTRPGPRRGRHRWARGSGSRPSVVLPGSAGGPEDLPGDEDATG